MEIDCSQRETIDRLYLKMGRAAIAKTLHVVGRVDVAAEIVQEVFIRLWRGGGKFPNEKAVYAWLFTSCHRAGIDHLRSAGRRHERELDDGGEAYVKDEISVGDLVLTRDLIRQGLAELSDSDAAIVLHVAFDQMKQTEVADLLGISRKTVERAMTKAMGVFQRLAG